MQKSILEITPTQMIRLRAQGHLRMRGWDQTSLSIATEAADSLEIHESNDEVVIDVHTGCEIRIPIAADVFIDYVHGSAVIKDLHGDIQITRIGGNLALERLGSTSVDKVYGNLRVREIDGTLRIGSVYGNTRIRHVKGRLEIEDQVKGNLLISDVAGMSASALGNARLNLNPKTDERYDVDVSGNIHLRIDPEANATIHTSSGVSRIRLDFADSAELLNQPTYQHSMGSGEPQITLEAKGHILLADRFTDQDAAIAYDEPQSDTHDVAQDINLMIDQQMDHLEQELSDHLSHLSDLDSMLDIDSIVEQARDHSQRAANQAKARAQAAARRAQEKLANKLERTRRKATPRARRSAQRKPWSQRVAGGGMSSSADPVSDEERLLVLRMLEENKITLQEAERLLDAMDDNGG